VSNGAAASLGFEGISFAIDGRPILRDIDLAIAPGEIVALVGPNGAGKTTLLRIASRVLTPDEGRVLLGGREASAFSRRELARKIAVVPQDVQVAFPFRAAEVVLMGRGPHLGAFGYESASDVAIARAAMERVGVAELADRSILELSGGERQMVLIARALAQEARVLLLDEPTAHLDLRHRIQVLALVREFVAEDRSALVVSHDLHLAARSCDRVGLLCGGALLAAGTPASVLTRENLRRSFEIDAEIVTGPDGAPIVVPRL